MVLCEISAGFSLPIIWAICTGLAWVSVMGLSGFVFYKFYWNPTFEMWQSKSCANFPAPEKVRDEIVQCNKGLLMAALPPAITLYLSSRGYSMGYCGFSDYPIWYHFASQLLFWFLTDFYEFFYHRATHVYKSLWAAHKYHHTFYNPSPFAVIADEILDQFVRACPMVIFPLLFPVNVDLMFFQMAVFSYGYGVYLHCGYELNYPDAHHPWINTSYSHYCHHAISIYNKPYHCGFFLKIFDRLFDCCYKGDCFCAKCARNKGDRTLEKWAEVKKHDYSVLLTLPFWLDAISTPVKQEVE